MIPARLNRLLILAAGGLMLTAGCASPKSSGSADRAPRPIEPAQMTQFDRWTVRSAGREQVDAAIVRQRDVVDLFMGLPVAVDPAFDDLDLIEVCGIGILHCLHHKGG